MDTAHPDFDFEAIDKALRSLGLRFEGAYGTARQDEEGNMIPDESGAIILHCRVTERAWEHAVNPRREEERAEIAGSEEASIDDEWEQMRRELGDEAGD